MGLVSSSVVRGHQRTRPMTSTSPMEESNRKAYVVGPTGSWDSGRDLGRLRGVQREGLHCGTMGSWDSRV